MRDSDEQQDDHEKQQRRINENFDVENIDLGGGNLNMQRERLFKYVDLIMANGEQQEKLQHLISSIKTKRLKTAETNEKSTMRGHGESVMAPVNSMFDTLA